MKKSLFPYKHGDVQSGNWEWAVGAEARIGERPLCVATLNFYGANAAGHDCEELAKCFAESVRDPDTLPSYADEAVAPDAAAARALYDICTGTEITPETYACPECGDDRHLYQKGADVRWMPEQRAWVTTGDYDLIECTSCDWSGELEATTVSVP